MWVDLHFQLVSAENCHKYSFFYSAVPDLVEISIKPLEPDLYSTTTAKPITNIANAGKEIAWYFGPKVMVSW